METIAFMIVVAALCLAIAGCPSRSADDRNRSLVGAIRWDAWVAGSEWEQNLSPPQWRDRLPFYGREVAPDKVEIRGDTQQVMESEIAYAAGAGLDYWAFCYSHPRAGKVDQHSYGLNLYLSSKRKADLNFCLILMGAGYSGPQEEWRTAAVEGFIKLFREPTYQKVLGARPLLYIFYVNGMPRYFGSEAAVKEALDYLRAETIAAGLQPPYIVAMVWSGQMGTEAVDKMGFDAISAYASVDLIHGDQGYPYSTLAAANRQFWEECRATGKQVIPIVSAGWDPRPRWANAKRFEELYQSPPRGPWYEQPTPQELADNLRAALEWNRQNEAQAEANAVIIYAWNESDEGGWLVPTRSEGAARLDAIQRVLRTRRSRASAH